MMVRARGLVKRFGDFTAVDGIDVEVRRGEAFGFLGPNGAGKSSTMRMIGCVSPATGGELASSAATRTATGRRSGPGSASCRSRTRSTPSSPSWTTCYLRPLLRASRAESGARAVELLEFAQLADRADEHVEPLSGGMKRRLTIARALVNEPELLLWTSPPPAWTRRPGTCCGTGCSGSSSRA